MTTGQRTVASMLAVVAVLPLLTGCYSAPTWRAYTGPKLPDEQTALIVNGSTVDTFGGAGAFIVKIDGVTSPAGARELFTYRGAIRMLPGTHDMEVRFLEQRGPFYGAVWAAPRHVTLNAKAGRTYSLHWHEVKKGDDYLWIEDELGSVVAGEKPPAEGPVDVVGGVGAVLVARDGRPGSWTALLGGAAPLQRA